MKKRVQALAVAVIFVGGFGGMKLIEAAGQETEEKEVVDTRPVVSVEPLSTVDYTITIESFGEVQPLEQTRLASQVSGEVTSWHPNFVPGGVIPRGEVLFTIEKDAYEAAVLLAEANVQRAYADLIQEQAQAKVAENEAKNLPPARVTDLYLRKPQLLSAQAAYKSAKAQLQIAQRDLANCEVRAPYDALVINRNIGVGDFVSTGTVAATLNNIEVAEVTFPIAGFDRPFVSQNMIAKPAIISQVNQPGTIDAVLHRDLGIVDESTRMTHFVARIEDPYALKSQKPVVKFGSYVSVTFDGMTLQDVYKVPQELVNNRKLWMVDDEGKLFSHDVTVIRENGAYFMIQADSQISQPVVMTLPEYPQTGMEVKVSAEPSTKVDSDDGLIVSRNQQ
ncbi:efflux RND transporter periplasmic adaptor subunit [Alteromonas sediminis]|uniref:Efflux RND transporter periplasmic adaptor subunit n=1 Tax=Alteromonas sediminis TaxID=2259342 RepID=A0A3N5Y5W6_9ALTE|nr:efflux RND transporter periplasmic adaptor subunit [Alteromonas sediminis]RPJ68606.1 efflux RND transporter periplasmic adaptor subunit [Alteromonas sediminis]